MRMQNRLQVVMSASALVLGWWSTNSGNAAQKPSRRVAFGYEWLAPNFGHVSEISHLYSTMLRSSTWQSCYFAIFGVTRRTPPARTVNSFTLKTSPPLFPPPPAIELQIRAAVKSHLHYHPEARILITGHSLGGALATLCFLDLLSIHGDKVAFAPLYIYGTPRVGNAAFATYTASHGVPVFRVVHNRDPVPHLPFQAWGYVHPAREVFFDAPQTSFAVCDDSGEDPTCSDKFWVMPDLVHVYDHLSYLEVDYTKAYVQCLIGNEEDDENVEKWIWNPSHQA